MVVGPIFYNSLRIFFLIVPERVTLALGYVKNELIECF